MERSDQAEDQLWAVCYATAAALLTLGGTIKHGFDWSEKRIAQEVDDRAALIADRAVARLKDKIP